MLKVGGTVLRGEWDELYGSEIVLAEGKWCSTIINAAKSHGDKPASLEPLHPVDGSSAPSGASSTSTHRIAFTPVRPLDEIDMEL